MRTIHATLLVLICLWAGLVRSPLVYGQAVPDRQWTKAGGNITSVADGNLVASIDGLPAGQIAGTGIVKYRLTGEPIWTTLLQGSTPLAGRLGLSVSVFQSVDNVTTTADGGVVLHGKEFGTGLGLLTRVSATGVQSNNIVLGTDDGFDDLIGTPDGGFLAVFTAFANFTDTHKDTYIQKYSSQNNLVWSRQIEYPNTPPGGVDQSITKAEAVINALGGGYILSGYYSAIGPPNTIPATDFDPVTSGRGTGWVAKLDENGTVSWQKLLTGFQVQFQNGGPAPGSMVTTRTITDVIVAADGNGYTLAGAGIPPSGIAIPPPAMCLVELATDGAIKQGRLNSLAPTKAFLALSTIKGIRYYTIGTTPTGSGSVLALINPTELFLIVTQRNFTGPSNTDLRVLTTLSDGSLGFSTSQEINKVNADAVPAAVGILLPTYDCTTGQLTINVSGASNSNTPLEYQILGLRAWGPSPTFTVPTYQRTSTTFLMEVRQGKLVLGAPFTSACTSSSVTQFTMLPPVYDCNTGALTLQVSGASGNLEFRVAGLRDWAPSPVFVVPLYQKLNTTFTLEARLVNGQGTSLAFTTSCATLAPPTTSDLTFAIPTLNCSSNGSAQLLINLVGIPFSPPNGIEYKVPGLADWQPSNAFTVPAYQTKGTNFTLYVRRVNTQPQFTTQFMATCPASARLASSDVAQTLDVVLLPNPVNEQLTVDVRGAAQQTVHFDLTDNQGRLLQSRQVDVEESSHRETFSLRQAASGLYLLRVTTGQQVVTMKALKP